MKNLLLPIFFLTISTFLHGQEITNCDTGRENLNNLSPQDRSDLNELIRQFLNEGAPTNPTSTTQFPRINEHIVNFPQIHTQNQITSNVGTDFADWHRYYILELEQFLLDQGEERFVPLPYWNPQTTIPSEFQGTGGLVNSNITVGGFPIQPPGNGPTNANFNDIINLTASDCNNWASPDEFANDLEFGGGIHHNRVHNDLGGVMASGSSPAATIFWPWHAYVDDVWFCYQKTCLSGSPNLVVRDCDDDDGTEPSSCTPLHLSPDIWVRNSNDGFANRTSESLFQATDDNKAYIYVRIFNEGNIPLGPDEATVDVWWANASTGLSWPEPWNNQLSIDCNGNDVALGNHVGTYQIGRIMEPYIQTNVTPQVNTGPFTIVEIEWDMPDPDEFVDCFNEGWESRHFCLLARVNDGSTFNMSPFYSAVQNYNNLAFKNITIYGDGEFFVNNPDTICTLFANFKAQPMNDVSLGLELAGDPNNNIFDVADVNMVLQPSEHNAWVNSQKEGQYFTEQSDGSLQLLQDGANIGGIAMAVDHVAPYCLTITPHTPSTETFEFDIIQRDGARVIGGERYRIKGISQAQAKGTAPVQHDNTRSKQRTIVYPNPGEDLIFYEAPVNTEMAKLTLYDMKGKLMENRKLNGTISGKINVAKLPRGIYSLRITLSDGTTEIHKVVLK